MSQLSVLTLLFAAPLIGFVCEWIYRRRTDPAGSGFSPPTRDDVRSGYSLITAIGFFVTTAWALYAAPSSWLLHSVLLGWLLVLLARIDLERMILPDVLNFGVFALGLTLLIDAPNQIRVDRIAGAVIGFGLFWTIDQVYLKLRGRPGLGRGDAKLIGALGLWVGATGLTSVILLASALALVGLAAFRLRSNQGVPTETEFPFGPALAAGGWWVWLYGPLFY
ncbi:MAG: A24 family peptidase [Pseudomonadota bacterium]